MFLNILFYKWIDWLLVGRFLDWLYGWVNHFGYSIVLWQVMIRLLPARVVIAQSRHGLCWIKQISVQMRLLFYDLLVSLSRRLRHTRNNRVTWTSPWMEPKFLKWYMFFSFVLSLDSLAGSYLTENFQKNVNHAVPKKVQFGSPVELPRAFLLRENFLLLQWTMDTKAEPDEVWIFMSFNSN